MATRSLIGIKTKKGKFKVVYCHHDGYFDGVGATLLKYHNSYDKIKSIVDKGDLSSLGKSVNRPKNCKKNTGYTYFIKKNAKNNSYQDFNLDYSFFYKRDRGNAGCEAKIFDDLNKEVFIKYGTEYLYLWDEVENKLIQKKI